MDVKIAAATWHFPPSVGGLETNLLNLYRTIARLGHEVKVVATFSGCPPFTPREETLDGIEVRRVHGLARMASGLREAARDADVIHVHQYATALAALPTAVLYGKPLVFEAHGYDMACLVGNLFARGRECTEPFSLGCIGCPGFFPPRAAANYFMTKALVGRISAWTAISGYVKKKLVEAHGIPGERIRVAYNGVDWKAFQAPKDKARKFVSEKGWAGEGDVIVVAAGSLQEAKGQRLALLAAAEVLKARKNTKLIFAGDGPDAARLARTAAKLKIGKQVIFTGKLPWKSMPLVFRAADVSLTPSLWPEAFGNITTEAMASGLPVIGTNRGATPEIIRNGVTGFVVEPVQRELAEKLELLLDDAALRKKMGKKGAELAKKFSWRKTAAGILEVFEETGGKA